MTRFVLVLAALTLPGLTSAEEMWRWRDATGHLHYSNVQANAPADAVSVRTKLGTMEGNVAPAPVAEKPTGTRAARSRTPAVERPAWMQEVGGCTSPYPYLCAPLAVPYILTIQGNDLADQVKEASLLDSLHVRWRSGFCP